MNTLAWNNKIGLWYYFVGLRTKVMINRDSWGYSYLIDRGEILGFMLPFAAVAAYLGWH